MILLNSSAGVLNWVLLPHVHTLNALQRNKPRQSPEAEFGAPLNAGEIAQAARTKDGRQRLRRCYNALWVDQNLISMTLYQGPLRGEDFIAIYPRLQICSRQAAWILTGDAHLERRLRRDAFAQRYRPVLEQVGALMLPHHGATANFDRELLDLFPELRVGFAAAGRNGYGHPHEGVRQAVRATRHGRFIRVGSAVKSSLSVEVRSV
jgi:hypothetical protein